MLFKRLFLAVVLLFIFSFHPASLRAEGDEAVDDTGTTLLSVPVRIEKASMMQGENKLQFFVVVQNKSAREVSVRLGMELRAESQEETVSVVAYAVGSADTKTIAAGQSLEAEFSVDVPELPMGKYKVYIGAAEDKTTRFVAKKLVASVQLGSEKSVALSDCAIGSQEFSNGLIVATLTDAHFKDEIVCRISGFSGEERAGRVLVRFKDRPFSNGKDIASEEIVFGSNSKSTTLPFDIEALPGSYDLEVLPVDNNGRVIGAAIQSRLALSGKGAKILSFSNLSGEYQAGQGVVLETLVRNFSDLALTLRIDFTSNDEACADPVMVPVTAELVRAKVTLKTDCVQPTASLSLTDADGNVLDTLKQQFSAAALPQENNTETQLSVDGSTFSLWRLLWLAPLLVLVVWLAVRRVRNAGGLSVRALVYVLFILGASLGMTRQAHAGSTNFNLWYICGPGPGCPAATAVWYNFDTDKEIYAPGETITVWALLSSDDNPQTPLCPVVRIGINGGGYTGDLVPGCYSEQDFRSGVDLTFTVTAPATPGPFNLSFSVGLSGYAVPPVQNIPLIVSAPAPAPTVTLNPFTPSTITAGSTSSISFSSTNATSCVGAGIWNGNVGTSNTGISTPAMAAGTYTQSVTCSGPGGSATSVTRTLQVNPAVIAPTAIISANGPVAFSKPHWWQKALSVITGSDFVAQAGGGAVITVGENAALTWSSTNATSCTISGNGLNRTDLNFSNYVLTGLPTGVFTYNINCSNVAGTATDSTTITVNPPRVDGVCAGTHYNCSAGTPRLDGDTATAYNWTCMGSGGGFNSSPCTEAKAVSVPGTPSSISATPGSCGSGSISINWTASAGATSYQLRDGGVQIYDGPLTTFTHTALADGSSHSYTVRATNAGGSSAWSAAANTSAPAACAGGAPGIPASLTATPAACDTGLISVNWGNVAGATSYQLRDGGVQIYDGAASSFNHTGLAAGSLHNYTVRATNTNGSSSWSGNVSANAPNTCTTTTVNGVCGAAAETCAAGTYSNFPADTTTNYQWTCLGAGIPVGTNSGTCTAPIPTTYTITASAGSGGFISPSGSISGIPAGSSRTFTITANFPSVIDTVTINTGSGPINIGAPSSYTFNNITSNGSISVTFRAGTSSGITQAQGCTISAGNSTCTGRVSWTTAGDAVPPIEMSVAGTTFFSNNPAGANQPVLMDFGTHRVTLRDQGSIFEQANMTAVCFGALLWSQGICQTSGGSLSASPTSCVIPVGQSTCDVNFTWWTQNLASASVYNWTRGIVYSTALSGTAQPFPIGFGNNTVRLRDASLATRDSVTVRGTCAGIWNATFGVCEAGTPAATITVATCAIPDGASTCNAQISWTSSNLTSTPSIQQDGVEFSTTSIVPPSTLTRPITHTLVGGNTFTFVHNTTTLDTKNIGATCAGTLIWDGAKCTSVCIPTDNCGNHATDIENVCVGSQYVISNDGCGNSISCPGTRSCDYNWKEVAP